MDHTHDILTIGPTFIRLIIINVDISSIIIKFVKLINAKDCNYSTSE